jgi:hypothetical protein
VQNSLSWVFDSSKRVSEVKAEKAGAYRRNRSKQALRVKGGITPIRAGGITPRRPRMCVWTDIVSVIAPHRHRRAFTRLAFRRNTSTRTHGQPRFLAWHVQMRLFQKETVVETSSIALSRNIPNCATAAYSRAFTLPNCNQVVGNRAERRARRRKNRVTTHTQNSPTNNVISTHVAKVRTRYTAMKSADTSHWYL